MPSTSSAVSPPATIDTVSVPVLNWVESGSLTVALLPWSMTSAPAPSA